MVYDNQRRLTEELTRDKERKLEEQKDFYESKLKKQKSNFMTRLKHKQPNKKEKILSPLQVYKQKEKDESEVAEYKRYKFRRGTRIGRAQRFFQTRGYGANYLKPKKVSSRELQLMRLRLQIEKARARGMAQPRRFYPQQVNTPNNFQRNLRIRAAQMGWNPQDLDSNAWDDFFVSANLERDVKLNSNPAGLELRHSWSGARVANDIEREVGFNSRTASPKSANVGDESLFFAKLTDIMPTLQLESEVSNIANILNPNYRRRKKR